MSWRGVVVGGVVVAVLVGGAVAVDAVARSRAEARVAAELSEALSLGEQPEVSIGGPSFLWQVAQGSLDEVAVTSDAARLGELDMTELRLDLADVETSEPYVAAEVEFTAFVPLDSVRAVNHPTLDIAIDRGLVVVAAEVFGFRLEAGFEPRAAGDQVELDLQTVGIGGLTVAVSDLPPQVADLLSGVHVPLELIDGLELTSVEVEPDGFRIAAAGTDVALAAGSGG